MKKENLFYLIMILTMVVIRLRVYLSPDGEIKLLGIVLHHIWFGVLLTGLSFAIPKKMQYSKIVIYGIGIGLFIDEIIFMILGGGGDPEYWAIPSSIGTAVIALALFPIRDKLLKS